MLDIKTTSVFVFRHPKSKVPEGLSDHIFGDRVEHLVSGTCKKVFDPKSILQKVYRNSLFFAVRNHLVNHIRYILLDL